MMLIMMTMTVMLMTMNIMMMMMMMMKKRPNLKATEATPFLVLVGKFMAVIFKDKNN